jgi:hypothetical protein
MSTTSGASRRFPLLVLAATLITLSGCVSSTEGVLDTFAGEWCTLRGLGTNSMPVPGIAYVGMTLLEEGGVVYGSGSTSRPGSDVIYPARFRGDVTGGQAVITVSDLADAPTVPGPHFVLQLRGDGPRDMVGTMSGDPDFTGPITLVRLGPRCFKE